jgi:hypothetical protein
MPWARLQWAEYETSENSYVTTTTHSISTGSNSINIMSILS